MKKNAFFGILVALLALLGAGATVASAATINEQVTFYGFAIGYIFLAIAGLMIVIPLLLMKKKTVFKTPVFIIFIIVFAVIGMLCFANMPSNLVNPPDTGQITPDVTWKVTTTATGNSTRINDDANTITVTVDVNVTAGTVLYKGGGPAFVTPTITFSCRPDPNSGSITDLTQGATMQATGTDPGKVIYYGGTDYALVTKNSEGTKAFLNWTYGGSTELENRLITVQFGSTGVVNFTVNWNEAGVSKMSEGDSKTIPLSVAGETWTVQIFVSTVYS